MLLAGLYSDDCTSVIRWLRDAQPEVAALCVLDSGAEIADRDAIYQELHDAWLSHRLKLDIRLPTEWEWERAARDINGRVYPWGDEYLAGHANIDETWGDAGIHHMDRTTAVGIYPQGASSDGVLDLSGNVWEWCLGHRRGTRPSRIPVPARRRRWRQCAPPGPATADQSGICSICPSGWRDQWTESA